MRKKSVQKGPKISPLAVKLDPQLKSRLEKLSRTKDRSVHWLMKTAIEHYVALEESEEALRQETQRRWEAEALSDHVVSNDSVMAWLQTWGTDHEVDQPK